ncbi:MAG: hypothetical protein AB1810_00465 [Pseudomonadota bacterium]
MNIYRLPVTRVAFLALAILTGLPGGPAFGQSAVAAVTTPLSIPKTGLLLPISGSVTGLPEDILIAGNVRINCTVALDPDFGGPPSFIVSFDFLNVNGRGLSTGRSYVTNYHVEKIRARTVTDTIDITFPIVPISADGTLGISETRIGMATFTVQFDTAGNIRGLTKGSITPSPL